MDSHSISGQVDCVPKNCEEDKDVSNIQESFNSETESAQKQSFSIDEQNNAAGESSVQMTDLNSKLECHTSDIHLRICKVEAGDGDATHPSSPRIEESLEEVPEGINSLQTLPPYLPPTPPGENALATGAFVQDTFPANDVDSVKYSSLPPRLPLPMQEELDSSELPETTTQLDKFPVGTFPPMPLNAPMYQDTLQDVMQSPCPAPCQPSQASVLSHGKVKILQRPKASSGKEQGNHHSTARSSTKGNQSQRDSSPTNCEGTGKHKCALIHICSIDI